MGKGDGDPGRPPQAPAGSQDGGPQPPLPTNGGVALPARSRELVLQVPPTPPATAKDADGTAAPTTAGGSSRLRNATRGLLVDSTPAATAEVTRPPCYLEKASIWSVLTFGWMNPVIKMGNERVLTEKDMPELPKVDTAEHLRDLAQKHWDAERAAHPEDPKLWRALFKAFFPMQVPMFLPFLVVTAAKILQAHVGVKGLIESLDNNRPAKDGYYYAGVIVAMGLVQLMLHHQVQFMGWRLGLAMRTSLEAAVFRKVVRMPLSLLSLGDQSAAPKGGIDVGSPNGEKETAKEAAKREQRAAQKAQDDAYKSKITAATVINLATTDVERFQPVGVHSHYLFLCPLEIAAITWCGVTETGLPFVVGMVVLLLLIPIQARVAKLLQRASKEASQLTDERVRLTKQAIQGARTIKMSGWELLMDARIRKARAVEVVVLVKAGLVRGVHEGIYFLSPVLVGAATFVADSLLGRELDAGRVFSTLTLFNILQWDVVNFAGKAMQSVSEMWVSIGRLERLLLMPELPSGRLEPDPSPLTSPAGSPTHGVMTVRAPDCLAGHDGCARVHVDGLTFAWEGEHGNGIPTLRNVSFQAAPGKILGLTGPVGAGKTTLLLAILGELALGGEEGGAGQGQGQGKKPPVVVTPPSAIAYAAQEPWILTGSVRDNIVMGRRFDAERYRAVLKAACLAPDLRQWEHGDHTVIGDRGVNMSGGQKARIGLARMAYGDAALYLIDDALSALDPKVGRRVFDRLICGLLRGKTRLLATHQLQYLMAEEEVPSVLFINRGKLRAEGTLNELVSRGFFKDLLLPTSTPKDARHAANGTPPLLLPAVPSLGSQGSRGSGQSSPPPSPPPPPPQQQQQQRISRVSSQQDQALLAEQCMEQNLPEMKPDAEPVLIDLNRQETLTADQVALLAAAIKTGQEAATAQAASLGAAAAGAGSIPPASPLAASWVRFRSRSHAGGKTPKGSGGGGGASGKPRGHFSAELDEPNEGVLDATVPTPLGRTGRAHRVSIAVLARQGGAGLPGSAITTPSAAASSPAGVSVSFAAGIDADTDSPAGSITPGGVLFPPMAQQQLINRARAASVGSLNIGVLPSAAPSSARSARSARHAASRSNVSLSLPFIDDGHDGGVALATEGDCEEATPRTSRYDDEFNFHHDTLTEKEQRKKIAYLNAREAEARARAAEPDSDEEIDKGLERGDIDAQEREEEEEMDKKRAVLALVDSIVSVEEQKAGGLVKGTYRAYLDGMGGPLVGVGVLVLIMAGQASAIVSNLFLSRWVHMPFEQEQKRRNIYIYVSLVALVAVLAITRAMVAYHRMLRASQRLHDDMVHSVLRAPVSFFDTNPTGRIINRTTKDVLICDSVLPVMVYAFLQTIFMCIGTVVVVVSVNPWLLLVLAPLLAAFVPFRRQFLNTSREARRLEAVARSPVYALFSEVLDGLATIRALRAGAMFQAEFSSRLDAFSRPYFIFFAAGRHLGFRLDFLCWLMMAATAFSSLAARDHASGVSEWLLGMSLMYVLQLAAIFQWATRQSSDVENQIVSVERILEYTRLPPEAALDSAPGHAPRPTWPEKGAIECRGLQVAYRPGLPLVLKGLTFFIEGGQRVGICGRTGSGKSSLIQALFRLMEPAGGAILIDGVDTAALGLHDLRRRIAVIPQNPFLFSGTLRENLDPMGQHDDAALWTALRAVQMEDQVKMMGVDFHDYYTPSAKAPGARGASTKGGGGGNVARSNADLAAVAALAQAVEAAAVAASSARRLAGPGASEEGGHSAAAAAVAEVAAAMPTPKAGSVRAFNFNGDVGGHGGHGGHGGSAAPPEMLNTKHHRGSSVGLLMVGPDGQPLSGPGLDMLVTENGGNFSLGERQLICLARAILQDARILVCDEATANVDIETDAKIQRAIRERFASATVLMIAHRLNTIIDSDLILMLDAGQVLEMGHPHQLLNEGRGLAAGGFASLVAETGPETEQSLKDMAREYWELKHGGPGAGAGRD